MKNLWYAMVILVVFVVFTPRCLAHHDDSDEPRSFTVSKGGTLDIKVNIGTIHVTTWDKNEVVVHVMGEESDEEDAEDYGVRIRQRENTIRVTSSQHFQAWSDIDIEASIPAQFNIQIETSAGDIVIDGKVIGTVDIQTSGGNISTGSIEGKTDLATSGGDVMTGDIKGELSLTTSGGNIHLGSVTGNAEVETLGGDIVIERVDKVLSASTSGGNVRAGDIGEGGTITTSGGDIILDHVGSNASLSTAGGNIMVTSARGIVSATTAGGDIRADSIVGSITARTSSGNIDVMLIPSGTGKSKLSTSVGDIQFYIPENAKASITAKNRLQYWGPWGDDDEDVIVSDYKEESYDREGRGRDVRATYVLNGGGQNITLEASMGNIRIFKPDSRMYDSSHGSKKRKKSKR